MNNFFVQILIGKSGAQNTILDLDVDGTTDGWVDTAGNRWYCSYADARETCSNPVSGQNCPAGPTTSEDITAMTDAQMETAYSGQFATTFPRNGGIGYDASQASFQIDTSFRLADFLGSNLDDE